MHFTNEAEAVIAIASLVISSDEVGTASERQYLFDHVSHMDTFRGVDPDQFKGMLSAVNDRLFGTEDSAARWLKPNGMREFCDAVRATVPVMRMGDILEMACEMACADGLQSVERELLESLGRGLGITTEVVGPILLRIEQKNQ